MRLYTFINYYLSSIQQGIQTAHIQGELTNYVFTNRLHQEKLDMIKDWSLNHKTIICCNGGNSESIEEFTRFLCDFSNPYPFAIFNEDQNSLQGVCTGLGIILPPEIYDVKVEFVFDNKTRERTKKFVFDDGIIHIEYIEPTSYLYQLIDRIKSAPLAR